VTWGTLAMLLATGWFGYTLGSFRARKPCTCLNPWECGRPHAVEGDDNDDDETKLGV